MSSNQLLLNHPGNVSLKEFKINKKEESQKMGLMMKTVVNQKGIIISGLSQTSPLKGTGIHSGQLLLAVNGDNRLPTVRTAATKIGNHKSLSLLVCERPRDSCTSIVTASFSRKSPGISFSSTRGRTLVTVSRIFPSGPFAQQNDLQQGDIVLAVNGIPVSKPEEADKALRRPVAGLTVLHVVSLSKFRALVVGSVDTKRVKHCDVSIHKKLADDGQDLWWMEAGNLWMGTKAFALVFDPETQHMTDPAPFTKLVSDCDMFTYEWENPEVFFRSWYTQGALRYICLYNDIVDRNLQALEEAVCEAAWQHSLA